MIKLSEEILTALTKSIVSVIVFFVLRSSFEVPPPPGLTQQASGRVFAAIRLFAVRSDPSRPYSGLDRSYSERDSSMKLSRYASIFGSPRLALAPLRVALTIDIIPCSNLRCQPPQEKSRISEAKRPPATYCIFWGCFVKERFPVGCE